MNSETRSRWLSVLLLSSVILIGASQKFSLPPIVGILLGCAPLVFYHWGVLAPKRNGPLISPDVDSVYYFGFLITIASLGFGVYFFQTGGKQDIQTLLRQFAVGIMATAYAVFARMHLSAHNARGEVSDPQAMLDQQLLQSQEVLQHMMSVSIQAQALAASLSAAREQVVQRSAEEMTAVLGDIASAFGQRVGTALERLHGVTGQVETTLSAINDVLVEQAMAKNLQELSLAAKALGQNTAAVASSSLEAATAITMAGQEFKEIQSVLSTARTELRVVEQVSDSLRHLDSAASATAAAIDGAGSELLRVTNELKDVGNAVGTAPRTMKRLADQVERTADGIEVLLGVTSKMSVAAESLSQAAGTADALTSSLDSLSRVVPQALAGMSQVESVSTESARGLGAFASSVNSAGVAVAKLESATDGLEKSSAGFNGLGRAADDVLGRLTAFSTQMLRSQEQMAAASIHLNESTRASAVSLQREMEAATASTAQVSRRLVELVSTIVEQTRRQQSARV